VPAGADRVEGVPAGLRCCWVGLAALHQRTRPEVLALPAVREQLTHMGLTVGHMNPAQLAAREQAYTQVWRKIIQTSGFQPQ
jgi:hypothetical protein